MNWQERAEKAEAELARLREQNARAEAHTTELKFVIDEYRHENDRLSAIIKDAQEQKPYAYAVPDDNQMPTRVVKMTPWETLENLPLYAAPVPAVTAPAHHDDIAVALFAAAMKNKMASSRAKGRGGWENKHECPTERLQQMLIGHLSKGDPVDVANFCMMLWNRGELVVAPAVPKEWRETLSELVSEVRSSGGLCSTKVCGYAEGRNQCCRGALMDALAAADALLQSATQADKEWTYCWECNECGSQEYTMSVTPDVINSGQLACSNCGCDEFHKEVSHD